MDRVRSLTSAHGTRLHSLAGRLYTLARQTPENHLGSRHLTVSIPGTGHPRNSPRLARRGIQITAHCHRRWLAGSYAASTGRQESHERGRVFARLPTNNRRNLTIPFTMK